MRLTNRKSKRVISGLLATVTILSALIQPAVSFAEDLIMHLDTDIWILEQP